MDSSDFWEIDKKIGQPRDAMAAHLISGDEDLARAVAEGLTHDELITLVLFLERIYAFGTVQALQEAAGADSEQAKEWAVQKFRMFAAARSLESEDPEQ